MIIMILVLYFISLVLYTLSVLSSEEVLAMDYQIGAIYFILSAIFLRLMYDT